MRYVKLTSFSYVDRPNEQTLCLGRDATGYFVHQIIEDTDMEPGIPLEEAVRLTNDSTVEFASSQGFEVAFDDPSFISISGVRFAICKQSMKLPDGKRAVQENAYLNSPGDGVFRIIQFGTFALPGDVFEDEGEALEQYVHTVIRRLLGDMALPEDVRKLPIPVYRKAS